jgi:hypothetical protein
VPVIPVTWEIEIGGMWSRAAQAKMQDPTQKITNAKRAGDMAQVVERLSRVLSKHKALSSNSSTTKRNEYRNRKRRKSAVNK